MDILFLGDSLIEFFDWQERFPKHRVANLGLAGESVEGLLSRVIKIRDHYPQADLIFIMTGINNIAMGDEEFFDFYKVIIEKLASFYPDAKIFIHSLLPTMVDFISNESVQRANDSLKKIAQDKGVGFVDIYSRFIDTKGNPIGGYILDDGVHVSTYGYKVWSELIEKIINKC
jgi:lysophospholipase L1-like esterase